MRNVFASLIVLHVLMAGCSGSRTAGVGQTIRVMTYNIHHGEGLDGKVDIERIARVIRDARADIVALQEVDRGVERTKKIDIMTMLADQTGMTYAFGRNIDYQGGEYGNGILTRFPILEEKNFHYRMIREGEQRGLLQLVLEAQGEEFVFMNTHIDYRGDDTERVMNVGEIRSAAKAHGARPVIACGDFNDTPESRTVSLLKEDFFDAWEVGGTGPGLTYPADTAKKRIDYVFVSKTKGPVSGTLRVLSARVIQTHASDHLPLLVDLEFSRITP